MQWPVICVGPVCVPMNLVLPFLVGLAHRAGWLSWFRRDWVTLRYWRSFWCNVEQNKPAQPNNTSTGQPSSGSATHIALAQQKPQGNAAKEGGEQPGADRLPAGILSQGGQAAQNRQADLHQRQHSASTTR